jgi:aldose sugar dehydrogenase
MVSARFRGLQAPAWHAAALCLVLVVPSWLVFGTEFWRTPGQNQWIVVGLAATYLLFVGFSRSIARRVASIPVTTSAALIALLGLGAVCAALLLQPSPDYSRDFFLLESVFFLIVVAGRAIAVERSRGFLASWVIIVATVIGLAEVNGAVRSRRLTDQAQGHRHATRLVKASQQILKTDTYFNYFGRQAGTIVTGGALTADPAADGYLFARANGQIYKLAWAPDGDLQVTNLGIRVPANFADFYADAPPGSDLHSFRVADVIARKVGEGTRIYVSHHYWYRNRKCFVLRVSTAMLPVGMGRSRSSEAKWETLFETQPCLPIVASRGARFAGLQAGGNLEFLGENELLLTVGDHQFDGFFKPINYVQDLHAHYGKTVLIDVRTGQWSIYTVGHRNPQGLTVDARGRIWSTEQGPQGGDELNVLRKGGNYGYPMHTYGTEYGSTVWPPGREGSENDPSLIKPVYAWVPSIAPTDLVVVSDPAFPRWKDDLLIACLRGQAIWRVRIDAGRVAYAEPIPMGHRIRDIVAGRGEFVLLTDSDEIIRIRPDDVVTGGAELFTIDCGGCHRETENHIGPRLIGVVGREIASVPHYDYTPALARMEGLWTEERLDRFIANPRSEAPGSAMAIDGIKDTEGRRKIIEYLKHIR